MYLYRSDIYSNTVSLKDSYIEVIAKQVQVSTSVDMAPALVTPIGKCPLTESNVDNISELVISMNTFGVSLSALYLPARLVELNGNLVEEAGGFSSPVVMRSNSTNYSDSSTSEFEFHFPITDEHLKTIKDDLSIGEDLFFYFLLGKMDYEDDYNKYYTSKFNIHKIFFI